MFYVLSYCEILNLLWAFKCEGMGICEHLVHLWCPFHIRCYPSSQGSWRKGGRPEMGRHWGPCLLSDLSGEAPWGILSKTAFLITCPPSLTMSLRPVGLGIVARISGRNPARNLTCISWPLCWDCKQDHHMAPGRRCNSSHCGLHHQLVSQRPPKKWLDSHELWVSHLNKSWFRNSEAATSSEFCGAAVPSGAHTTTAPLGLDTLSVPSSLTLVHGGEQEKSLQAGPVIKN